MSEQQTFAAPPAVEVDLRNPGILPPETQDCGRYFGTELQSGMEHEWFLVSLSDQDWGAVWACRRCRRIEELTVVS